MYDDLTNSRLNTRFDPDVTTGKYHSWTLDSLVHTAFMLDENHE